MSAEKLAWAGAAWEPHGGDLAECADFSNARGLCVLGLGTAVARVRRNMFQRIRLFSQGPSRAPGGEQGLLLSLFPRTDWRRGGGLGTEVLRGSQKLEDKFGLKELVGNWSESSLPTLGRSPVCLSAPICGLGVKFLLGGVPA